LGGACALEPAYAVMIAARTDLAGFPGLSGCICL